MASKIEPIFDPEKARAAIDCGPRKRWWRRQGSPRRGFFYAAPDGSRITRQEHLERIAALVIPPAWRHVRIAPGPRSRVQAVGMDTRGRIQYIYHPRFAERQQKKKFERIETFGRHLPRLRRITNEHIQLPGLPREKTLAVMLRLINSLYFRVGSERSARHYRTYGITTLTNRHLTIGRDGTLIFDFVGKSHVRHRKVLVDEELAALMKELKGIGGKRKLFHYLDDEGRPVPVKPADLNRYLKEATAPEYSTKDLRTWGGTLLTAAYLAELGPPEDEAQAKRNIVKAVKHVAEYLGNTPTVCRGSYIHPAILKLYQKGTTLQDFAPRRTRRIRKVEAELDPEEEALIRLFSST